MARGGGGGGRVEKAQRLGQACFHDELRSSSSAANLESMRIPRLYCIACARTSPRDPSVCQGPQAFLTDRGIGELCDRNCPMARVYGKLLLDPKRHKTRKQMCARGRAAPCAPRGRRRLKPGGRKHACIEREAARDIVSNRGATPELDHAAQLRPRVLNCFLGRKPPAAPATSSPMHREP